MKAINKAKEIVAKASEFNFLVKEVTIQSYKNKLEELDTLEDSFPKRFLSNCTSEGLKAIEESPHKWYWLALAQLQYTIRFPNTLIRSL